MERCRPHASRATPCALQADRDYSSGEALETPLRRRSPQSQTERSANPLPPGTSDEGGSDAPPKRTRRSSTTTSTPVTAPPQLLCPACDRPLVYLETVFSGANPIERW